MEQTGYKIFKEDNRLTLVIDNPTSETVALIMQLFGAGIKDLTGLDPVKQEPMTVPSEKPVSEKEVAEPVTEQETKETATESQQVSETTPVLEADETVVKEESATEDEQSEEEKKKQISGYSPYLPSPPHSQYFHTRYSGRDFQPYVCGSHLL